MKSDANKRDPNYIHMWFETGLKSGCGLIRYQCKYADTLKMDLTELKQTRFHYLQNADSK